MTMTYAITLTAADATEYAALKDYVTSITTANAEFSGRANDDGNLAVTVTWTRTGVEVPK